GELGSEPFFGSAGRGSLSQDLFFSFTTMTTVGYGNLVPAAHPGQAKAQIEGVARPLFPIAARGKIIRNIRPTPGRRARPAARPHSSGQLRSGTMLAMAR